MDFIDKHIHKAERVRGDNIEHEKQENRTLKKH